MVLNYGKYSLYKRVKERHFKLREKERQSLKGKIKERIMMCEGTSNSLDLLEP